MSAELKETPHASDVLYMAILGARGSEPITRDGHFTLKPGECKAFTAPKGCEDMPELKNFRIYAMHIPFPPEIAAVLSEKYSGLIISCGWTPTQKWGLFDVALCPKEK